MDKGVEEVNTGVEMVENVGKALEEILVTINNADIQVTKISSDVAKLGSSSENVVVMVEKIAKATEDISENAKNIHQITEKTATSAEDISSVTEQTAASVQEVASITEEQSANLQEIDASYVNLIELAEKLKSKTSIFKI